MTESFGEERKRGIRFKESFPAIIITFILGNLSALATIYGQFEKKDASLRQNVQTLESEVGELTAEREEWQREEVSLRADNRALRDDKRSLGDELSKLRSDLNDRDKSCNGLRQELESCKSDVSKFMRGEKERESKTLALQNENERLNKSNSDLEQERIDLQQQVAKLKSETPNKVPGKQDPSQQDNNKQPSGFWASIQDLRSLKPKGFASVLGENYGYMDTAVSTAKVPNTIGVIILRKTTALVIVASGSSCAKMIERRSSLLRSMQLPAGWSVQGDEQAARLTVSTPTGEISIEAIQVPELYDFSIQNYFTKILKQNPPPPWVLAVRI